MLHSKNAILICKHYEGFYPKAYLCPAGKATIGYGTTRYPNGVKVRIGDPPMTEQVASDILSQTLASVSKDVSALLKIAITQNQFDSLVCFGHNVGTDMNHNGIAEGLGDSTLLKLINLNLMETAPDWKQRLSSHFEAWCWGGNPKKKMSGLLFRRQTEAFLFCEGIVKYFNIIK